MPLWVFVTELYQQTINTVHHVTDYIKSYYKGSYKTWFFIEGHTLPLPESHIKNNIIANWKYTDHCLTYLKKSTNNRCSFSWLSAKINVTTKEDEYEYDIDPFLSSFKLYTYDNHVPTLTILFLSWCAETNHWFPPDCIVEFHVIDHHGDNQVFTISLEDDSLDVRNHKIYNLTKPRTPIPIPNPYTYYHG